MYLPQTAKCFQITNKKSEERFSPASNLSSIGHNAADRIPSLAFPLRDGGESNRVFLQYVYLPSVIKMSPARIPPALICKGAEMDSVVALIYLPFLSFFNGAALKDVVCGCQRNI